MQSKTKKEIFIVLEQYHQILKNENLKAAPDKSPFFLTRVKFLGHITERNTKSIKITHRRHSKTSATNK